MGADPELTAQGGALYRPGQQTPGRVEADPDQRWPDADGAGADSEQAFDGVELGVGIEVAAVGQRSPQHVGVARHHRRMRRPIGLCQEPTQPGSTV